MRLAFQQFNSLAPGAAGFPLGARAANQANEDRDISRLA